MAYFNVNKFINKLLSPRQSIFKGAKGFYISSRSLPYKCSHLFLTKNCPVKLSNCGYFTKSYDISSNFTLYGPMATVRKCGTKSDCEKPEPKPSLYQRFKSMYRDYWYVLLPVHMITSAAWYAGFYYMASSGVDIVALLEQLNVNEKFINPLRNGHSTTGYLAIAFALYKIATPLRYTVTLGGTTLTINYLKKSGYIKPVPSREKLKELYEGKKEIFKEKGHHLKENMIKSLKPTTSKKSSSKKT